MSVLRTMAMVGLLAVIACSGREDAPGSGEPLPDAEEARSLPDSLDHLREQVREMVGEASASSVESCRTLPFGAKPCGGPWTYLVFSVEVTDSTELAALVDRYNEVEDTLNREEGRVSDCALVRRAPVALEGERCVARR